MSAKQTKAISESQKNHSEPYSISDPYSTQESIYQDKEGTWMVQPAHKEGWIIEPHALYNPPDSIEIEEYEGKK